MKLCTFLISITFLATVNCARILGIFHVPSKSHHILGSKLLLALAERGHEVIMASPYPFKHKVKNYRDIFLEDMLQYKEDKLQDMMKHNASAFATTKLILNVFHNLTDLVLSNQEIQALKHEKIDLVIQYALFTESFLGLAHHWNAPVILMNTLGGIPLLDRTLGNTSPPSYVSSMSGAFTVADKMTFLQRLVNALSVWFQYVIVAPILDYKQKTMLSKHFPNAPCLHELVDNVSLVFLNSHYSIESPRPYVPNMIQIGGFHIEEPKELPLELKSFLDSASEGAVFFSLGSNVKISTLPRERLQAIITSLGKLNMKVLLKTEVDLDNLPPNIKTGSWLPQNDILGHPNVKLFISHGGLLSTTEAVYHAVPIVGIPIFAEQKLNVADAAQKGYAIKVDLEEITEETFTKDINEILHNPKYRENIQLRSSLMKDDPIRPLDKAIYWVEHVLKYGGARHLKNGANKLYLFQYLLLDVVAFVLVAALLATFIFYYVTKKAILLFKKVVRTVKRKQD